MSRNHHLICLPHHAPKIIDGTKTTTIRAPRSRPIEVGDTITFARWTANPYRSKQERVRVVTVTSVRKIDLNRIPGECVDIAIDGQAVSDEEYRRIATCDGFEFAADMANYLTSDKQPEFSGFIYGWEHAEQCQSCHRELANGEQQYSCEVCNKDCCTACSDSCGRRDVVCDACLDSVCED